MAIRKIIIILAIIVCLEALLIAMGGLSLGGSDETGLSITGKMIDQVPYDAQPVASQAAIDALPSGSNAVLTSDVSDLVLSRPVRLFGDRHQAGSITLAADDIRVSGLVASSLKVKGDGCVVDHCTITADGIDAIRAEGVSGLQVLDNRIYGYQVKNSNGLYADNCPDLRAERNQVSGAYIAFNLNHCARPQVIGNYVSHADGFRQGIDFYMDYCTNGVFRGNEVEFNPYHGSGHAEDHDAIGFNHADGLLIEDNTAGGHYYTLKIYNSKNCVIQNNTLYRAGSMRTGFYDSNLVVRNNRISGEPAAGVSIGIWINDGTKDSLYEGNEIWDCEYGVEESHYPAGYRYLDGGPSLPCSNITLKNNYIHDCSGAYIVMQDKGSLIQIDNYNTPKPTPTPTPGPVVTATPVVTPVVTSGATPGVQPSPTPLVSSGNSIIDFITSIIRLIFH